MGNLLLNWLTKFLVYVVSTIQIILGFYKKKKRLGDIFEYEKDCLKLSSMHKIVTIVPLR